MESLDSFIRRIAPSPLALLCSMTVLSTSPMALAATITTPITAGTGQNITIPADSTVQVASGYAISASGGGIIAGNGTIAITNGDTNAVNSSGGSLISLNGATLTGARGGIWIGIAGQVALTGNTVINTTGSAAGSAGIYVLNNTTVPAGMLDNVTINVTGTHASGNYSAFMGIAVNNASASFNNVTVQGPSADIGASVTNGTLKLSNSNITVNGTDPNGYIGIWPISTNIYGVRNSGVFNGHGGRAELDNVNITVNSLDGASGIVNFNGGSLDMRNSTITVTGTAEAGIYTGTSNGSSNVVNIVNSQINVTGTDSYGLSVSGVSTVTADGLTILMSGASSTGLRVAGTNNVVVTATNSSVTTTGANSTALSMRGTGARTNLTNTKVAAKGVNNIGVMFSGANNVLTMSGGSVTSTENTFQVTGAGAVVNLSDAAVVTAGNAYLLDVQGTGDVALTASTGSELTGNIHSVTQNNAAITLNSDSRWNGAANNIGAVALNGGAFWTMTGDSDVGSLSIDNATLAFAAPDNAFKTLTVRGDYVGNNGLITLNTQLDGDASPSNKLVVEGNTSGQSLLKIVNSNGAGALTSGNGIEVVTVQGASDGHFALNERVAAGAYDYNLYKGAVDGSDDNRNWYLRSTRPVDPVDPVDPVNPVNPEDSGGSTGGGKQVPNIRPEVPVDMVIPSLAIKYASMTADLSSNIEPESWFFTANDATCADDSKQQRTGSENKSVQCSERTPIGEASSQWFSGSWARIFGERGIRDSDSFSSRGPNYDYDSAGVQIGVGVFDHQQANGTLDKLGVYVGYGQIAADVEDMFNSKAGTINMDAYTVGGYWHHASPSRWYTNTIIQSTFYSADAKSTYGKQVNPDGLGLLASLEGGYSHILGNNWTLEPQAQLAYQLVSLDDAQDAYGKFSYGNTESLLSRAGLRLNKAWDTTGVRQLNTWGRVNVWHEFMGESKMTATSLNGQNPVTFTSDLGGTLGGIDVGISGKVSDKVSVYSGAGYSQSLDNSGMKSWNGRIGVSVQW
ncbi:autotransporter outer membrane beta-barrel domain-containing protein [Budvicia diplopodorum]|uniref:autotransporter family protein n=1 Tax=Budvicia diplopodorum TaxID=1119056 RepID=UPI0013596ED6|nr:autotransporter outer membrane beta-barrel domain-containing protein [Budvicia diplopodorum]